MSTKVTKTNTATELVLGHGAQQIAKAINELNYATKALTSLVEQSDDLTLQVTNKQAQIAELETQFKEKLRQSNVSFELDVKADAEKVIGDVLKASGRVAIAQAELTNLQNELTRIKAETDKAVSTAVAQVTNSLKAEHTNAIKLLQSENNALAAESKAAITVLMDKVKFYEEQNAKLFVEISENRKAETARAQASSVGAINVGTTPNGSR